MEYRVAARVRAGCGQETARQDCGGKRAKKNRYPRTCKIRGIGKEVGGQTKGGRGWRKDGRQKEEATGQNEDWDTSKGS